MACAISSPLSDGHYMFPTNLCSSIRTNDSYRFWSVHAMVGVFTVAAVGIWDCARIHNCDLSTFMLTKIFLGTSFGCSDNGKGFKSYFGKHKLLPILFIQKAGSYGRRSYLWRMPHRLMLA